MNSYNDMRTLNVRSTLMRNKSLDSGNIAVDNGKRLFMSGSTYVGQWNPQMHCMDGFGIYHYPNGDEYRGFFKNGLFHGYGRIILAFPYKLIFNGVFESGKMVHFDDEIHFSDGLPFTFRLEGDRIDMSGWRYLHYVYKQTCAEILERNLEVPASKCPRTSDRVCLSDRDKFYKHYMPRICDRGSFWHERDPAEVSMCTSKESSLDSLSCDTVRDATLIQECREPASCGTACQSSQEEERKEEETEEEENESVVQMKHFIDEQLH